MRDYNFYSSLTNSVDMILKSNFYSSVEYDVNNSITYLTIWSSDTVLPVEAYDIERYIKLYNTDEVNTLVQVFRALLNTYIVSE